MNNLYNKVLLNISKGVLKSLNEMSKNINFRNIDRNLWLSVSSMCSRNKDTEAEFVKPYGSRKNDLIDQMQRYVAALLIMKKPCPLSEADIDKLKTYKFIGHHAIELGATIEDIQSCYDINSGKSTSADNKVENKHLNLKEEKRTISEIERIIFSLSTEDLYRTYFRKKEEDIMSNKLNAQDLVSLICNICVALGYLTEPKCMYRRPYMYFDTYHGKMTFGSWGGKYVKYEQYYFVPKGHYAPYCTADKNWVNYMPDEGTSYWEMAKTDTLVVNFMDYETPAWSIIHDEYTLSLVIKKLAEKNYISHYMYDAGKQIIDWDYRQKYIDNHKDDYEWFMKNKHI